MASFGENLRRAREARNITLKEIAASTKIGTRALQALEDERFDLLPGGIFNKGFVRAYARCVGLDEEKTVADYMAAARVEAPEIDMQAMSTQIVAAAPAKPESRMNAATVVGIVAVIVALGLGALWLREQRREAQEQAAAQRRAEAPVVSAAAPPAVPTPIDTKPVATPATDASTNPAPAQPQTADQNATVPAATSATTNLSRNATPTVTPAASAVAQPVPTAVAPKGPPAPVEVSISATERAWISVSSDGKLVETLTLDPDKPESRSRSYKAQERLLLVVGNPAGITVTYNGKPAGTLGTEGQRAKITFTPKGIDKQ